MKLYQKLILVILTLLLTSKYGYEVKRIGCIGSGHYIVKPIKLESDLEFIK